MSKRATHGISNWLTTFALVFSLATSIGGLAYSAGVLSTRVDYVQSDVKDLKTEQKLLSELSKNVAVMAAQLDNISKSVARLEKHLGDDPRK